MKKLILFIQSAVVFSLLLFLASCSEEEGTSCPDTDNAVIDGNCYWGFMLDYDIVGEWTDDGFLVRTLSESIVLEFRGAGPTYKLYINGGHTYYDPETELWTQDYGLLEEGVTYTNRDNAGTSMTEQDMGSGELTVVITKVDRENKLISGTFRWVTSRQNSSFESVEDIIEGEFNDVIAGINAE